VRAALGARLKARVINHFARRLRDSANRACLARRVVLPNRLISPFTRDKTELPAEQADTEIRRLSRSSSPKGESQVATFLRLVAARSREGEGEDVLRRPKTSLRGCQEEVSGMVFYLWRGFVPCRASRDEISRSHGNVGLDARFGARFRAQLRVQRVSVRGCPISGRNYR